MELDRRERFAAVTARCADPEGNPRGDPYPADPYDASFLDLAFRLRNRSEKWHFVRTDVMREHPFPEPDHYVPEGVVWLRIGERYLNRCINDTLRVYHTAGGESVSKGPRMKYHRGLAYAAAFHLNRHLPLLARHPTELARLLVNYGRYNRHAGRGLGESLRPLRGGLPRLLCTAAYPFSAALALRDRALGKVQDETGPQYARFDRPPRDPHAAGGATPARVVRSP